MSAADYARQPNHRAHNAGELWTDSDDRAITAADRPSDTTLARLLGRTLQAVHNRRSELGAAEGRHVIDVAKPAGESGRDIVTRLDPRMAALLYA